MGLAAERRGIGNWNCKKDKRLCKGGMVRSGSGCGTCGLSLRLVSKHERNRLNQVTFDEFEICPVRMNSKYIAPHYLASMKSPCNLSASCHNLASGPLSDLSSPHENRTALATSHCFMMSSPLIGPPRDLIVSHDDLTASSCLSLQQSRLRLVIGMFSFFDMDAIRADLEADLGENYGRAVLLHQ
ncbi:hypothetical protein M5K25_027665 [Dendrobium thyrsiflorum]|uniref:Uncharacterized protein n=1 Tax=Dendrobium thyrsiflorum TaxID=117978 RepID=A0ABD0TUF8_DENTH